jgi:hypothetical protein
MRVPWNATRASSRSGSRTSGAEHRPAALDSRWFAYVAGAVRHVFPPETRDVRPRPPIGPVLASGRLVPPAPLAATTRFTTQRRSDAGTLGVQQATDSVRTCLSVRNALNESAPSGHQHECDSRQPACSLLVVCTECCTGGLVITRHGRRAARPEPAGPGARRLPGRPGDVRATGRHHRAGAGALGGLASSIAAATTSRRPNCTSKPR